MTNHLVHGKMFKRVNNHPKTQKQTKAPAETKPSRTETKRKNKSQQKIKKDPMAALQQAAFFQKPDALQANETLMALSASGGISSTKELRMTFTDYFDTSNDAAAGYFQWVWSGSQSAFTGGSGVPLGGFIPSYVLGAELYALPKFALDSVASSILIVTTCPVICGNSSLTAAGAVQSTLVLPTSVQKWVKVGSWTASQLFDSSEYLPAIETETGNQPIFSGVCLNPDSLAVAASNVQMKIVLHLAQAIPPTIKMGFGVTNSANAGCLHSPIGGISTTAKDCLVQVTGLSNTI